MDFSEILRKRRMVRNYLPDPVDPAVLERILTAAHTAPSAGFAQGQEFIVVTESSRRHRIAELAGEPGFAERGFPRWLTNAPVHVIVTVSESKYRKRYAEPDKAESRLAAAAEWPVPYWWVDGGASLMLLLLAAVDEGLAAGFLGAHAIPGIEALAGVPSGVGVVGIVTLGHPAPDPRSGSLDRGRRDMDEVVHWEQW